MKRFMGLPAFRPNCTLLTQVFSKVTHCIEKNKIFLNTMCDASYFFKMGSSRTSKDCWLVIEPERRVSQ